jgi:hypothetical protein
MKLTGENRQLVEKPVPVPLCPPQISHGLDLGSNPGLRGERPATNRLSQIYTTLQEWNFFIFMQGPRTTALRFLCNPNEDDEDEQFFLEHQWNEIDRGKPTTRRKTCPSATLSTTNLTWTWPGTETWASVVRGRLLTAWAMARPYTSDITAGNSTFCPLICHNTEWK